MSVPSTARVRTSRLRRGSAAAAIVAGLVLSGTAVVSAGAPMPGAPTTSAANVIGLTKGAHGDNVRALQEALNRVGIGVKYGVDGYFGSATQASVKAFQNYKGLPITGVVDAATAAALGFSAGRGGTAVAAASSGGGSAVLAVGSSGAAVRQLQQLLINAGQSVGGGIDGLYGTMTANAVKRFQQAKGLPVTGTVDAATLQALQAAGSAAAAPAGTIAQGARGNQVTSIQQAPDRRGLRRRRRRRRHLRRGDGERGEAVPAGQGPAGDRDRRSADARPPSAARRPRRPLPRPRLRPPPRARRSSVSAPGCVARPCRRCSGPS